MGNTGDYSRFGPELRRVRAGERANERGEKKVWHQAGPDVEIISHVDPEGRVTRQECHVGEVVAVWQRGEPVTTGSVTAGTRSASETILPDADPSRAVVLQALSLLRAAPPGDRYVDHLRGELEHALRGLADDSEDTVTSAFQQSLERPALPREKQSSPLLPLAIGAAVVIAAGLAVFFLR